MIIWIIPDVGLSGGPKGVSFVHCFIALVAIRPHGSSDAVTFAVMEEREALSVLSDKTSNFAELTVCDQKKKKENYKYLVGKNGSVTLGRWYSTVLRLLPVSPSVAYQ